VAGQLSCLYLNRLERTPINQKRVFFVVRKSKKCQNRFVFIVDQKKNRKVTHRLGHDDFVEVLLVFTRVLTPVDGTELENAVAAAGGACSSGDLLLLGARGDVLGTSVGSSDGLLLGVRRRRGGSQREEGRLGSRGEGEELLRRKGRHFGVDLGCWACGGVKGVQEAESCASCLRL